MGAFASQPISSLHLTHQDNRTHPLVGLVPHEFEVRVTGMLTVRARNMDPAVCKAS